MTPKSEAEKDLIEIAERIVIDYANLSGRESTNRAEFRERALGHLTTAYRKGCERGREEAIDASVPFGEAFHLGVEVGRKRERAEILARLPKEVNEDGDPDAPIDKDYIMGKQKGWNNCLAELKATIEEVGIKNK